MANYLPRTRTILMLAAFAILWGLNAATDLYAQRPPYDVFPPTDPPYYRVRYEASTRKGELIFPVNYTIWIPKGVKSLRGVIVHQHGCGEGSCKSGLTGAYDLHWQALAKKHDCALLAPSYEQPDKADCQMWCDPRNGSAAAFQKCLVDLGAKSGHPELPKLPWALWGHSGGGHWAGGMVLLYPDRVAAAWLRSGVPMLKADTKRATIKAHTLPDAALKVPVMCNLGTKEGVTVKGDRFAGVWPQNEAFFNEVRGKGGLIAVAVDPLSSHDCGNQRYLAIPWLDACLSARLPKVSGDPLKAMPTDQAWLAVTGAEAFPAAKFAGDPLKAAWLPNEAIAKAWLQYVKDTAVTDITPPPAPTHVRLQGNELTWEAEADLESGLANFIIERDGKLLTTVPEQGKNPFGRPIFQNLQYSDTPPQPLVPMQYIDTKAKLGKKHTYRVIAVNTVGLKSKPSAASVTIPVSSRPEDRVLKIGKAEQVGMSSLRLERVKQILTEETKSGRVTAASVLVARRGIIVLRGGWGSLAPDPASAYAGPETVYIVASISKPITVLMLMLLVERGEVSLNDPVQKYLPEFQGPGREKVRVQDLLTHTSGLPDMLPENVKLREANAPLADFVKGAMTTPLLFEPRTSFTYSSMGTLLAAEIVERATRMPLAQFEQRELFTPLKMKNSSLGLGKRALADTARVQGDSFAKSEKDLDRYGANSSYLRKLGHPWGGMHTTVDDLGIVLQMFLNGGAYDGKRILGRATVEAMTTDRNKRLGQPWGLGWGLQTSSGGNAFGDLSSTRTFGHSGASGTLAWADPQRELLCVILTTRPSRLDRGSLLRRIANVVQAAIE